MITNILLAITILVCFRIHVILGLIVFWVIYTQCWKSSVPRKDQGDVNEPS